MVSVLKEIEEVYHRYHFNAVAFVDDTFNLVPKRVIEICHGIVEKKLDLWWWCLSRIDLLLRNEEMVKEMVKAGAKSVFIGVESSSPRDPRRVEKGDSCGGNRSDRGDAKTEWPGDSCLLYPGRAPRYRQDDS